MKFIKLLTLLFIPFISTAQFKRLKSFELTEVIVGLSLDRAGDLYLNTQQGQIQKFSNDGVLKDVYKTIPPPTLFDPRDGARLFSFYRESHSYDLLTPTFATIASYKIDSAFVIEPWLACTSGDTKLWLIDASDGSLKKINPKAGEIEVDIKLNPDIKITNITYIREYQGFVFILLKDTGIIIFNGIGKEIRKIEEHAIITAFNFLGEELYYVIDGKMIFFDLFSVETREIKLPGLCSFAVVSDDRLYMANGKTVEIFSFKP